MALQYDGRVLRRGEQVQFVLKELVSIGENSLAHSFLDEEEKTQLVSEYSEDLSMFAG